MAPTSPLIEESLMDQFNRLRELAFGQHPLYGSGVTTPQLALLDWIAESPGSGIHDIAEGQGLTDPTVSVGVRRLEAAGLLERRPNPRDGRAVQTFLTARGKILQGRLRVFRREKMQRLLRGLTAEEGAVLIALLKKAIDAAEESDVG